MLRVHICGELACALIPLACLPSFLSFAETLFCCLWTVLHTFCHFVQRRRTPHLLSGELQGILTPSWVIQFYYWKLLFLPSNSDISESSHVPLCNEAKLNPFDYKYPKFCGFFYISFYLGKKCIINIPLQRKWGQVKRYIFLHPDNGSQNT